MPTHVLDTDQATKLSFVASTRLPTPWGTFLLHGFEADGHEHLALTVGRLDGDEPVLCRIHSECLTGDALFSQRCDCGAQLSAAMAAIADAGRGVILYLRQEGRGIGLLNKLRAYALQDMGLDTVDANLQLGFAPDARNYAMCRPMFEHLGVGRVQLMTNNPRKVAALEAQGIEVVERLPHQAGACATNARYLATKAERLGHFLPGNLTRPDIRRYA
ncbi:GTP cyclohydrolase II [Nitrogeniibacter aestuarii]|uniref:GTP cyclohydrolase II n=1 Tax=Nitrogeniibacter aestuarii TaxID=2815343 RepID=UPI001D129113|nr:GTP cyclohydrolase II [Nitrogeniibacter aestuarii]